MATRDYRRMPSADPHRDGWVRVQKAAAGSKNKPETIEIGASGCRNVISI